METKKGNDDFSMLDEYRQLLSRKSNFKAREGKSCSISAKHHARISQITSLINEKDMSISNYVDLVLEEHFQKYGNAVDYFMVEKFKDVLRKSREG